MTAEPTDLLAAALGYAAWGWPVFPCNPKNKQPLLAAKKDETGKPIKGTGGVSAASSDPDQVTTWWKKWPQALIGLACGHPTKGTETPAQPAGLCLFVLDFDPRADLDTGEVWTLERLKRETEEQLGCALPVSMAALTPSDGVHLYLLKGDDGPAITNRGNLPQHVDVRGLGGYVIAPPSVMGPNAAKGQSGLRYRWHRREPIGGIAKAPERLLEVLRERGGKGVSSETSTDPAKVSAPSKSQQPVRALDDAVRKYALSALDGECRELAATPIGGGQWGGRNQGIYHAALKLGTLAGAGALSESAIRAALGDVVRSMPHNDDIQGAMQTLENGLAYGVAHPRDLSEIAEAARQRRERPAPASGHLRPPPSSATEGRQSSQSGGAGFEAERRGCGGGQEPNSGELTRKCAFHPLTDLGNLERFLERFGRDFLFVEAWGWLAWDGRRWNREMALPLLAKSAQATVRAIQSEADFIRMSGVPFPDPLGDIDLDGDDAEVHPRELDLEQKRRKAKSQAWYRQRHIARQVPDHGGQRLDSIVQVKSSGEIVLYSDKLAAWGRTSESSGHIACLGKPDMAGARVAAMPIEFDAEPLMLNVENGTIVFLRPDQGSKASWSIREHRREDRMTKICAAPHDSRAQCPRFDAFLAKVQPDPEMRGFLDVWSGYNALGLADAQKMALFYGEGSNGKGVWINSVAHILGDYAWATGIETFIDQGRYRKGSDASPDLAALAGRRMIYANEPEEGSKFSDGLIKELTSDEPKGGVRELMKPPFELQITFSNTVSANTQPAIGTDHGIQRRVQVVPWNVVISDAEADPRLKDKLKAEASGILNRIITGAVQYLDDGLPAPEAVKAATREYQQDNDLLGKFIQLVVARVPGEIVGARPLHRVFAAWQTWAGQLPASGKPWSEKHLNKQLRKKRFDLTKSSTMKWRDIALRYAETDFCEHSLEGAILRPHETDLPAPRRFDGEVGLDGKPIEDIAPAPPDPHRQDDEDDDLPF